MNTSQVSLAMLVAVLAVGCSQSSPLTGPSPVSMASGSSGLAARATEVPFKGRLEGDFTFEPEPAPSTFAVVAFTSVAGQATHLGGFSIEAPHRVNLATLPPEATGTFRLTAANGDTLTATFTGLGTPTATPGVFSIVETATITGGTGRFAGATGSFVVERSVDLNTLFTTGSFDGVITYSGSSALTSSGTPTAAGSPCTGARCASGRALVVASRAGAGPVRS